jgi:hypothetical protein
MPKKAMQHEIYLRRQALLLASILPEDTDDAAKVIEYTSELLARFMCAQGVPAKQALTLVPMCRNFSEADSAGSG